MRNKLFKFWTVLSVILGATLMGYTFIAPLPVYAWSVRWFHLVEDYHPWWKLDVYILDKDLPQDWTEDIQQLKQKLGPTFKVTVYSNGRGDRSRFTYQLFRPHYDSEALDADCDVEVSALEKSEYQKVDDLANWAQGMKEAYVAAKPQYADISDKRVYKKSEKSAAAIPVGFRRWFVLNEP
jgi:hypothetical protein